MQNLHVITQKAHTLSWALEHGLNDIDAQWQLRYQDPGEAMKKISWAEVDQKEFASLILEGATSLEFDVQNGITESADMIVLNQRVTIFRNEGYMLLTEYRRPFSLKIEHKFQYFVNAILLHDHAELTEAQIFRLMKANIACFGEASERRLFSK